MELPSLVSFSIAISLQGVWLLLPTDPIHLPHPIESQHRMQQHLGPNRTVFFLAKLLGVVAHALSARNENHARRAPFASVHAVVARAARHLHGKAVAVWSENPPRRLGNGIDAVRMERRGWTVKVLGNGHAAGQARRAALAQARDVFSCRDLGKVLLDEGQHLCDGFVLGGAHVEREADLSWDRVCASRLEVQDAGRGEGAVGGGEAVAVEDHLAACEQRVGPALQIRGSRVRVPAFDVDGEPLVGLHASHDADLLVGHLEERALFDV